MKKRALAGLAAVLVLLVSRVAWVSGAHAIRFLEPRFVYDHEELSRKIIRDRAQIDAFFAGKVKHSTAVFVSALPRLERFLVEAEKRGIVMQALPLRRMSQDQRGELAKSAAELQQASTHPGALRLPLDTQGNLDLMLVSLAKPLDEKQAKWLWAELPTLRFAQLEKDEAAPSEMTADPGFVSGFGTVRTGKRFSLWVGSTEEIRAQNRAAFVAQADALADEIMPTIEAAFDDPHMLPLLVEGDAKRLVPTAARLGKKPTDGGPFNPYGPLLDDQGMRVGAYAGQLQVRLLLTVKQAWGAQKNDPQPTYALQQLLERVSIPVAQRDADIDALLAKVRAAPEDRRGDLFDPLERLAKESALRGVGGQRVIDALVKDALRTDGDSMRKTAISELRWIDAPERDRVYLELMRTRRHEDVMSVISQSFGERPDATRVDALIAVYKDKQASEDARSWAKNGLQTAANSLKTPAQAALKQKVETALKADPLTE